MRQLVSALALALVITCSPTALPRPGGSGPSATARPIDSTDVITLREGGQQPSLVARRVATSEALRSMPDGVVLAEGATILALEPDGGSTVVKKIDRGSGTMTGSNKVEGVWQFYLGIGSPRGASPDGSHVVLYGSSYNFTDQTGRWTAHTTFGVLDVASLQVERIELDGHYGLDGVSNDGRFVYLIEYTSAQSADSRLRVYDMRNRRFDGVAGELPSLSEAYRKVYIGASSFAVMSTTDSVRVSPDMIQVMPATNVIRLDLSSRAVRLVRLPITRTLMGEDAPMWSLVPSRDQKSLYVVNPAVGVAYEVDAGSLEIRRTAELNDAKSRQGVFDAALTYLHPLAAAKMGFGTPAVLSRDGASLYVLAAKGIWSIDLAAFKATMLTRDGYYETIALSPDGARLYVLSREDGIVSAIDARSGKLLGSMRRIAFPSEIVAVNAG